MRKMIYAFLHPHSFTQRQTELQEKTHAVKNETEAILLKYQVRSRHNRKVLNKTLTSAANELSHVAEQIAVATGAARRHR